MVVGNVLKRLIGEEMEKRRNGKHHELSVAAIIIGILISVLFGAANAYLGLKVGLTISASIPAAVIALFPIFLSLFSGFGLSFPILSVPRRKKRRNSADWSALFLRFGKITFHLCFESSQASACTDCWNCPCASISSISAAVCFSMRSSSISSRSWPVTFRQFPAAKSHT